MACPHGASSALWCSECQAPKSTGDSPTVRAKVGDPVPAGRQRRVNREAPEEEVCADCGAYRTVHPHPRCNRFVPKTPQQPTAGGQVPESEALLAAGLRIAFLPALDGRGQSYQQKVSWSVKRDFSSPCPCCGRTIGKAQPSFKIHYTSSTFKDTGGSYKVGDGWVCYTCFVVHGGKMRKQR